LYLYLKAFLDLDRERPVGFVEGVIPRRSIEEYAADFELSDEQTEALHHHVREMDSMVMKMRQDKAAAAKKNPPRKLTKRR
jgi:hypothetical protein